jgi:hypothetical protein
MVDFSRQPIELGHATVSPAAFAVLGIDGVRPLLRRHAAGDRGDLTALMRLDNAQAIASREGTVTSVYRLPVGVVLVVTELAPLQTSLLLAEEI